MNTAASNEPRIVTLEVTEDAIVAQLADGRTISVPLIWSWRLASAMLAQRGRFEIIGAGEGVHWPEIDEDISASGDVAGDTSVPTKASQGKTPAGMTKAGLAVLAHAKAAIAEPKESCIRASDSRLLAVAGARW